MMQKLLVFINSVIAVCTICSYISGFINPEISGVFSLFGLLYPYFLILNVFFIFFWLIVKWKNGFISILTLLIGWGHLISFFGLGLKEQIEITSNDLKVASFNINASYYIRNNDKAVEQRKVEFVKEQFINSKIDIFCMQEFSHYSKEMVRKLLPEYHLIDAKNNTAGIVTKYPVQDFGEIKFSRKWQSCLWADINYKGRTIRVYTVHLFSNKLTNRTREIMEERDFNNEKAYQDVKYIFGSYINSSRHRVDEVDKLKSHMAQCLHPIILTGDFNDTPQSYTHKQIMQADFCDAFQERGKGLGYTYGGPLPLLRIDYTFVDQNFEVVDHKVIRKKMSDHFPIVSTIRMKE